MALEIAIAPAPTLPPESRRARRVRRWLLGFVVLALGASGLAMTNGLILHGPTPVNQIARISAA